MRLENREVKGRLKQSLSASDLHPDYARKKTKPNYGSSMTFQHCASRSTHHGADRNSDRRKVRWAPGASHSPRLQLPQFQESQRRHDGVIQGIMGRPQRQAQVFHQAVKPQVNGATVTRLLRQLPVLVVVVQG